MKAYKATHNLQCLDQTYVIGETYTSDELKICESGFHFCNKMQDVLNYYIFDNDVVLIEVEILGDTQFKDDKGVTNKMKVLRIVPEEEWTFMTRNEKGNRVVNHKDSNGYEWLYEYDVKGNVTYYKDSDGYEYDVNGNITYYKDSSGLECWMKYNENGNEMYYKDSDGCEWWYEYDVNGNITYYKDSSGLECWYEYDERGNQTYYKNSRGFERGVSIKN